MPKSAIDLGTNSCLLTIAEVEQAQITRVFSDQMRIVRLGQGIDRTGQLHPDAIQRTMTALREYRDICASFQIPAEQVRVVATSAMRDATNRQALIEQAKQDLGLQIHVISGDREAEWSWQGALSQIEFSDHATPCLLDIGGGSTELVWANGEQRYSLQMGSVRATERYIHTDPPQADDLHKIEQALLTSLGSLPSMPQPQPLIAVAGTATTVFAMVHRIATYESSLVHGKILYRHELEPLLQQLVQMTSEQRKTLPGLHPQRADVIPAGATILLTVMNALHLDQVIISDRGLRFGVLQTESFPT